MNLRPEKVSRTSTSKRIKVPNEEKRKVLRHLSSALSNAQAKSKHQSTQSAVKSQQSYQSIFTFENPRKFQKML